MCVATLLHLLHRAVVFGIVFCTLTNILFVVSSFRKHLHKTERHNTMEICVQSFDGEKYTVEVGVDDTTADIRRKVASAAELREDGFDMSFGGDVMTEEDGARQLSAGDTVVLTNTKSQKNDAIAALRALGETELTPERFKDLDDPSLVHLFLQAEVVTEIPYGLLKGNLVKKLDIRDASVVTKISDQFLYGGYYLHTVDLSGWSNVTDIGNSFLRCFIHLTKVDLSGWNNVTHIGNHFLDECGSLIQLNISGWNNVTHLGDNFARQCISLRTLDWSGWASVTHIGRDALKHCYLRECTINATGSSKTVLDFKKKSKRQCVCM